MNFTRTLYPVDDGAKLAVWDSGGEGTPLVFVHGFPETHRSWDPLIRELQPQLKRSYRWITYDLRGHGESDKFGEASLSRFFADHQAVIQALGIGRYLLIGNDWGSAVALHVSRFAPDTLLRLVVTDTNYWKTDIRGMWHMLFLNLPVVPELSFRFFPDQMYDFAARRAFVDPSRLSPEVRESYLEQCRDPETTRFWIRLYRNLGKLLLGAAIPPARRFLKVSAIDLPPTPPNAFQVKTCLIWGKEDTFNPVWVGRDIEANLKKRGAEVSFHLLENAGHFLNEERPDQVAEILKGFLE